VITFWDSATTRKGGDILDKETFKPGETAKRSGQYEVIGPRGGRTGTEITMAKGETFPPPPDKSKGKTYTLVDPTKNKSGQGN
jgi:hypothetical protein